jgi:pyrimidine-nucleoside phosphorylase
MVDVIGKKRDGQALSAAEIQWFIREYTAGNLPDYQVSALLMAIFFQGMTREETVALTLAMAHSGQMLDLSDITDYAVDKHSSGGVGDKTTLVVLPLVAACGVPVAKMSGRGLGFSGGTIDKLEAIPGFRVSLSEQEFRAQARQYGLVLCGQTGELAPADGKIYALRDVTGTVPSMPLIASSIMSKKLASGAGGIVLDVKCGHGAFMPTVALAQELAAIMLNIGRDAGRDMIALISDMNQPLGAAVGNALEVAEAVATLAGGGPDDFRAHCVEVAACMLKLAGRGQRWQDMDDCRRTIETALHSGDGLAKLRLLVQIQGGDVSVIDDPARLPQAPHIATLTAEQGGYVAQVRADSVAQAALALGAGREKKGDVIDPAVGVIVPVKVGQVVQPGQPLATIHASSAASAAAAVPFLRQAITFSATPVEPLPLFYDVLL